MRSRLKNYLSLTKKEWNGMVVLVIVIALVLAAPYVCRHFHKDKLINFNNFDKAAALLDRAQKADSIAALKNPVNNVEAGKVFTSPKLKPGATVELNTADSAQLTTVHGIGPSFAMRIIRYRYRLGGYYNKEQLKEVYGIDAAKYNEIKNELTINRGAITKININTISFASLRQLPYLDYKQASALIEYRNQHGKYASMDDIRSVAIITPEIITKIEPYISFK
jgi:competence ComEA-like helix-hairpin-helix protein